MVETLPQPFGGSLHKNSRHASACCANNNRSGDSTPLVDLYDMEAEWGYTSREKFRGFKLHATVNQLGLPLRALVTLGNRYDGPFLPGLIEDLEADYVLADAAYYSKKNVRAVEDINAVPVIACNPRRGKRSEVKHGELLKTKRYVIEQFNGHVYTSKITCWMNVGHGQRAL